MKKTIFFCDIMGTIFGNSKNIEVDYDRFNELLKRIKEQDGSDEIIFSLISTDGFKTVHNAQETIKPYIQNTVDFGRQYFDKGYYTDENGDAQITVCSTTSKSTSIVNYINELLSSTDDISSIYFVDDVEMYHVMLRHLFNKGLGDNGLADRLHSIMPSKNQGLSETNELLEASLESSKSSQIHA